MSRQNKKTLSVVFAMMVFVLTAFLFSQSPGVSWKDYVDGQIESIRRAVDKADEAMTERLKVLNEFKDTYLRAQDKFAEQTDLDALEKIVQDLQYRYASIESVVGIGVDVKELRSTADIAKGAATQGQFFINMIYTSIALIIGVLGFFLNWKRSKK